ncbi:MAG TPA: hypothetical protein PLY87_02025 [Planctomycetaceae bacterium]|nr:hypothetical protein [Planctomycetaceae bacterium]HQZ63818.1 hypothetical protein [Planctomycetaceae bacterium]
MLKANPVISSIAAMLHRADPRKKASGSLSRILTQLDMLDLPYDEGVNTNRRRDVTRHVSIGIWLIPIDVNQTASSADTSLAKPAVTCDLRRQGIGVLVSEEQTAASFLVAVCDLDESWRFFLTELRHQTPRPGSWFHLGLDVLKIVEPEGLQMSRFRNRLQSK